MLRGYCLEWIAEHATEVLETESFRTLSTTNAPLVVEILRVTADPNGPAAPGIKRKREQKSDSQSDSAGKRRTSKRKRRTTSK